MEFTIKIEQTYPRVYTATSPQFSGYNGVAQNVAGAVRHLVLVLETDGHMDSIKDWADRQA